MDLSKIFRKGINPTKMGGQAVMEGIMMRGETKSALAVRLPDGTIKVETEDIKQQKKWMKLQRRFRQRLKGLEAAADTRRRRFYRLSYHGDRSVDEVGRAAGGSRR